MRVAVCLTSNDTSALARAHPDDAEKLRARVVPLAPDWTWETLDLTANVFPANPGDYDAYVVMGSPASVHDDFPWMKRLMDLMREVVGRRIPLVGLCLGHQAIALALGGAVTMRDTLVLGTRETAFDAQDWMLPPRERLTLYAAHKEEVSRLPEGARTIGRAPDCEHAAFVIGGRVMTTQYHPEMTPAFMNGLVEMAGDAVDADAARRELAAGAEGAVFCEWIVRFLRQTERT